MEKNKKEEPAFEVIQLTAEDTEIVLPFLQAEQARFAGNADDVLRDTAKLVLGCPGAMISYSKSGYHDRFPDHDVIFNANIFTEAGKKVWYGDLDITLSKPGLQQLSKELGEKIFVLYEWDGRFDFETNPRLDQAPWTCTPDGTIVSKF